MKINEICGNTFNRSEQLYLVLYYTKHNMLITEQNALERYSLDELFNSDIELKKFYYFIFKGYSEENTNFKQVALEKFYNYYIREENGPVFRITYNKYRLENLIL